MNKTIETIKIELNSIDDEINNLDNTYKTIQNSRKLQGLSLAIYACNDIQSLELQKIDNNIKTLENKEDSLRNELKALQLIDWKQFCKIEHEHFKDNKYMVIYNKDYQNKIYTNDPLYIEELKAMSIKENKDISIFEYIEYNHKIDITVNRPQLTCIYEFISEIKAVYNCIPHQLNYIPYSKVWKTLDGQLMQLEERGYNKNNEEIMTRLINLWGTEIINMKNTSIMDYMGIGRQDKHDITIKYQNVSSRVKNNHDSDIKTIIDNTLKGLSKNHDYKYNTDYLRNFMTS